MFFIKNFFELAIQFFEIKFLKNLTKLYDFINILKTARQIFYKQHK